MNLRKQPWMQQGDGVRAEEAAMCVIPSHTTQPLACTESFQNFHSYPARRRCKLCWMLNSRCLIFFVFPRPTCRSIRQHVRYLSDLHVHFCKDWGVISKPHPIRKPLRFGSRNQHQRIASALGKVSLLGLSKTNEAENTSLAHADCNVEFGLSPIDPTIYPLY